MFFRRLLILPFVLVTTLWAEPPTLEPRDISIQLKEVLKHHATHKELDRVLIARTLSNFIEELDPTRTYLTHAEVHAWLHPSPVLLEEVLRGYDRHDFHHFTKMYDVMVVAIERRAQIEARLEGHPLPDGVSADEFKDPSWAESEEELQERLFRLRALQIEAAQKLEPESGALALEHLQKRRRHRENKVLGSSREARAKLVLATVLKATTGALDSQTAYFTPDEASDFLNQLQRRLYGIGVQMRDNLNGFKVLRVIEGGPAHSQDVLRNGDLIVGVNGEPVVGLDILEAVQLIRGPQGSEVGLTVLREHVHEGESEEERVEVTIVRGEVVLKESRIETETEPFGDGVIGRIALHSFYQDRKNSSASDLGAAIDKMKAEHNLKGLILDLRNNAGGLLPQAVEVTGLFISRGVVCSIRDSDGRIHHLRDLSGECAWEGPLIVLVSRGSASASEIVAGCLQDYGRALIVGDPTTFGKGTFQTSTIDTLAGTYINPKGEFKVTRGSYYTTSGRSPQLEGVIADLVVPGIYSELELGERYAKFPLENSHIPPSFSDDLSDVPFGARLDLLRNYRHNIQPVLTTYAEHLDILQRNSDGRIEDNTDYQVFLSILRGEADEDELSTSRNDFQLIETFNIMKDLVVLTDEQPRKAA